MRWFGCTSKMFREKVTQSVTMHTAASQCIRHGRERHNAYGMAESVTMHTAWQRGTGVYIKASNNGLRRIQQRERVAAERCTAI